MSQENVTPDLARERSKATFDVENLAEFMIGGRDRLKRKRFLQNIAIQDPFFKKQKSWSFCSVEEQYDMGLSKSIYIQKKLQEMGITDMQEAFYYRECAAAHENSPLGLHYAMFLPTINKQATPEQKKKWLPLAENYKMIGTYAQTELGHGTFIRGLETTATYDPKTKEFILDSPTLTSKKYWPGCLGKTSNHCVVMAQLYTQGKSHGPHMFMVQIRSMEDHSVLPGIEVGVIGNKFGYGTNDNGFLSFDKLRIPRENMLMRYSQVHDDGTYVKPQNAKLAYGSMVLIRSSIVSDAARGLAQACVISIRYSAVRRQTEAYPGGEEPQILDYQTQQYRLFPLLASAYSLQLAGKYVFNTYLEVNDQIEKGNLESMPELHALSAGLKAFSTYEASAGIEVCRICCGGHGYSQASGLPKIYVDVVPGCTYEGENTVMMLQTARYLMKCYSRAKQGQKLPGFVQYIGQNLNKKSCMSEEVALGCLVMAYEHRAARLVEAAAMRMQSLIQGGKKQHEAWNGSSVQLFWAAKAHCHLFCVKNFVDAIQAKSLSSKTTTVMKSVCQLYGVHGILENLGEFMQDGFFSGEQVGYLQRKMLALFEDIRPNAVALVDAFDYPDMVLGSCLGRYDGQVYQALYDYAKSAPMNQTEIHSTYYKHLKPLINPETTSDAMQFAKL
ncbi:peroxisomal acyl-coenzyme A oxidase 1-like isoform X1 [Mytilus galloprovincialis]|uniref:peroxisomal acyl-coenzyme A oxidase 1-like isoform X1 n=2 Tax=Mytilus galloprovincialis TaxID=29158 RepID=UPI003F7C63A7